MSTPTSPQPMKRIHQAQLGWELGVCRLLILDTARREGFLEEESKLPGRLVPKILSKPDEQGPP